MSTRASAQRLGGERFTPAGSPDGILSIEGADTRPELLPYLALWGNYALNPVVLSMGDAEESLVQHFIGMDLVGSITLWKGLEIGAHLPLMLLREPESDVIAAVPDQSGAAVGDVTLRVAYRWQLGYFTALALHVPVLLPTSSDDNVIAYGFGVRPTLAFSQHWGRVQLLLNAFALLRDNETALDYTGGSEVGAKAGLRWAFGDHPNTALLFDVGVATATRDFFGPAETPAEIRGGIEHWFASHWRLTGFAGTAVSTGVGSPDLRAGLGIAYAPEAAKPRPTPQDRDGDGIPNNTDKCPNEKEDYDGFQDKDGCPEADNDKDGLLDGDDECPTAPETMNQFRDEDGCPDYVRLEGSEIITLQNIYFNTDSSQLADRSKPMVTEVAKIVDANPEMKLRVEGYADSVGPSQYNQQLSQKRAETVRTFLLEQGADEDRVSAKGYGEGKPIASNVTQRGRARNRRVEFRVKWEAQ
ncbi:MAG: OmpA family protein [Myxococcales bacterium]|nr:OmpA family protein [Myxococcales bacterium]